MASFSSGIENSVQVTVAISSESLPSFNFFLILPTTSTFPILKCLLTLHLNTPLSHSMVRLVVPCLIQSLCKAPLATLMALVTIHTPRLSSLANSQLIRLTRLQTHQPPPYQQTITAVPSKSLIIHPTAQNCLTTIRSFHRRRLQFKTIKVVPVRITTHRQLVVVGCLLSCRWRNSRSQPPPRSLRVLADEGMRHTLFVPSLVVGAPSLVDSTFEVGLIPHFVSLL